MSMTPKNGGKIELKLGPATSEGAEYEAILQTAGHTFRTSAQVSKQVVFGAWQTDATTEPPAWLLDDARAALKAAYRASQAPEGRWPRRITRWRPEPVE